MTNSSLEPRPLTVTIQSAARRLSVSAMTVRRLLESGQLTRVPIGRSVRITVESIENFVFRGGSRNGK